MNLRQELAHLRLRRPPGPPAYRMLPNIRGFMQDPLGFQAQLARNFGDLCYLRLGPGQIYCVHHPDLIEEVLVKRARYLIKDRITRELSAMLGQGLLTSDGALWKKQRKLAAPPLSRKQIAAYGDVMVAYTARACSTSKAPTGRASSASTTVLKPWGSRSQDAFGNAIG